MPTIEEVSRLIADDGNVDQIRTELVELIGQHLRALNDVNTLGYWEKWHLASAIAALAMNLRSGSVSRFWLRICLLDIVKALTAAEARDENYTPKDPQVEAITFNQLYQELRKVGG